MLTKLQSQCMEFLRSRLASSDVSPTYEEIAKALDLASKSQVSRLLDALEKRGFISRLSHQTRSIRILSHPSQGAGSVVDAAREVLASIVSEDLETGVAVIKADALGALDVAMAEFGS